MSPKGNNDKLMQIVEMLRDDIKVVREETSRHDVKLDSILVQCGEFKTKLDLLPCSERRTEIEALKKQTEENTHFRIKWTAITGFIYSGIIFLFVYVIPAVAKLL